MTCSECGEKPKSNCTRDFPRAVVEINNPEEIITLLRKVVIPLSMGTEEDVPASIGKYRNVILYYEANKHTYIYSSDGIPTLLEVDIPQEIWDRIADLEDGLIDERGARVDGDATLQQEIDDLKNSPDVVDIVATYADLMDYDTSKLGDNDVIRVLSDEEHDGESTYYRWDKHDETWLFIGAVGPYYTKDQTDELIDAAYGRARVLTTDDYDWPTSGMKNGVALWNLPAGVYSVKLGSEVYFYRTASSVRDTATGATDTLITVSGGTGTGQGNVVSITAWDSYLISDKAAARQYVFSNNTGSPLYTRSILTSQGVVDLLTSDSTDSPLSANQGKVLNEKIGQAKLLTSADYNWNKTAGSSTEPFDSIALWLLPTGTYYTDKSSSDLPILFESVTHPTQRDSGDLYAIVSRNVGAGNPPVAGAILYVSFPRAGGGGVRPLIVDVKRSSLSPYWTFNKSSRNNASSQNEILIGADISDEFRTNDANRPYLALSAHMGDVLNSRMNAFGDYSTSAVDTGARWTDNQHIYKKTIEISSLPNTTTTHYSIGETGVVEIIKLEGMAKISGGYYPLPYFSVDNNGNIEVDATTSNIVVSTSGDYSAASADVTVYFTKIS